MADTPSDSVQAAFGDRKGPKRISPSGCWCSMRRWGQPVQVRWGARGDTAPDARVRRPGCAGQACPAPSPCGFLTAGGSVSPVLKPLSSQGLSSREKGRQEWAGVGQSGGGWGRWAARLGGDPPPGPPGMLAKCDWGPPWPLCV